METFCGGKLYMPFVNWALTEDRDPTLQAEVYLYWVQQKMVCQQTHGKVEARRKLQIEQACLHNSTWHLLDANVYRHLLRSDTIT